MLGKQRVLDVVRPCEDDVAVVHDGEARRECTAGHAVAAHVVLRDWCRRTAGLRSSGSDGKSGLAVRRLVAQVLAVELVAVDVEDPGVDAAGLELVGDVDPIIVGRERVAGIELKHQAIARAARRTDDRRLLRDRDCSCRA